MPAIMCSEEARRSSGIGAAIARSLEESKAAAAVVERVRSEEVKRLSSIGAAIARSLEESKAAAAVVERVRSEEVKRLSSISAAVARSTEVLRAQANMATAALARSEETKRLSRIGSTISRSARAFDDFVPSARITHVGDVGTAEPGDGVEDRNEIAIRSDLALPAAVFSRTTHGKLVFGARFEVSLASIPIPQITGSYESDTTFNPKYWQILTQLEQSLRQFVGQHLENLAGPNWIKQRVPQAIRKRWIERQEEDRVDGRPVFSAIQYADFMDLADVIAKGDNWRDAFQEIFRCKDEIRVSLSRLHPVRKAVSHSRPLSRADVLTLVGETTRIFRAMGMKVLLATKYE